MREMRGLVTDGVLGSVLRQVTDPKQTGGTGENFAENFIVEKWHEFLLLLQSLLHWFAVNSWVFLVVVILLIGLPLLFCFFRYLVICLISVVGAAGSAIISCLSFLCSSLFYIIMAVGRLIRILVMGLVDCVKRCFPCFFSVGGKMMRAPGRAGVWILRATFESNPAAYFRLLRA